MHVARSRFCLRPQYLRQYAAPEGGYRGRDHCRCRTRPRPRRRPLHDLPHCPRRGRLLTRPGQRPISELRTSSGAFASRGAEAMIDAARGAGAPGKWGAVRLAKALAGIVALLAIESAPRVFAQAANDRSDAGIDADDARTDALLGTLNLATPQPYGNLYSTAPGAEE